MSKMPLKVLQRLILEMAGLKQLILKVTSKKKSWKWMLKWYQIWNNQNKRRRKKKLLTWKR